MISITLQSNAFDSSNGREAELPGELNAAKSRVQFIHTFYAAGFLPASNEKCLFGNRHCGLFDIFQIKLG